MRWVRRMLGLDDVVERVQPLEGTNMSLWHSIIPGWWAENIHGTAPVGTAALADRVWVANRCIQLNAQQIASMPLEFHSTAPSGGREPAWVSSPDPNWYPNGVGDALHAIVDQLYRHGFSCQYVTDTYDDGLPRSWTVLDSAVVNIRDEGGARAYKAGDDDLDPRRVVQIDRNPGTGLHGQPALRAYAQQAYGLLAAGNQSTGISSGAVPPGIIKSNRKLQAGQAEQIQDKWLEGAARRPGSPRVLGVDLDWITNSFDPEDMALLETQEFNAKAIATAYGVPSVLLNMALQGGLTYQNPAALGEMWWRFELRPTATRIANALTAQMLPRGSWVSFDAADTFAALDELSDDDDPQASQVAKASPAQQPAPQPRLEVVEVERGC